MAWCSLAMSSIVLKTRVFFQTRYLGSGIHVTLCFLATRRSLKQNHHQAEKRGWKAKMATSDRLTKCQPHGLLTQSRQAFSNPLIGSAKIGFCYPTSLLLR